MLYTYLFTHENYSRLYVRSLPSRPIFIGIFAQRSLNLNGNSINLLAEWICRCWRTHYWKLKIHTILWIRSQRRNEMFACTSLVYMSAVYIFSMRSRVSQQASERSILFAYTLFVLWIRGTKNEIKWKLSLCNFQKGRADLSRVKVSNGKKIFES